MKHEVLPIDKMGKLLTVGMACPLDTSTIGELEQMTGCRIKPVLVGMNDVKVAINRYYGDAKAPTFGHVEGLATISERPSTGAKLAAQASTSGAEKLVQPAAASVTPPSPILAKAESGIRIHPRMVRCCTAASTAQPACLAGNRGAGAPVGGKPGFERQGCRTGN